MKPPGKVHSPCPGSNPLRSSTISPAGVNGIAAATGLGLKKSTKPQLSQRSDRGGSFGSGRAALQAVLGVVESGVEAGHGRDAIGALGSGSHARVRASLARSPASHWRASASEELEGGPHDLASGSADAGRAGPA